MYICCSFFFSYSFFLFFSSSSSSSFHSCVWRNRGHCFVAVNIIIRFFFVVIIISSSLRFISLSQNSFSNVDVLIFISSYSHTKFYFLQFWNDHIINKFPVWIVCIHESISYLILLPLLTVCKRKSASRVQQEIIRFLAVEHVRFLRINCVLSDQS